MNLELQNRLGLVADSTTRIGFAIAKALATEGARVIINGRTEKRVKEAIASFRADVPSAKLEAVALDLSRTDAAVGALPASVRFFATHIDSDLCNLRRWHRRRDVFSRPPSDQIGRHPVV
jgi:NAD(P)-dependent dehydrogenase (short-subunit alcohol dehydrogenase family)